MRSKIPEKKQELLRQMDNNLITYAKWDFYIHSQGSTCFGAFAKKSNDKIN